MNDAVIVLFSAAITVVFTQGTIFRGIRGHGPALWRELVICALCSGVWIGAFATILIKQIPLQLNFHVLFQVLGMGSLTGCVAVMFVALWEFLDAIGGSVTAFRVGGSAFAKQIVDTIKEYQEQQKGPPQ